eukprot:2141152-Rhodomonas_salina.3
MRAFSGLPCNSCLTYATACGPSKRCPALPTQWPHASGKVPLSDGRYWPQDCRYWPSVSGTGLAYEDGAGRQPQARRGGEGGWEGWRESRGFPTREINYDWPINYYGRESKSEPHPRNRSTHTARSWRVSVFDCTDHGHSAARSVIPDSRSVIPDSRSVIPGRGSRAGALVVERAAALPVGSTLAVEPYG